MLHYSRSYKFSKIFVGFLALIFLFLILYQYFGNDIILRVSSKDSISLFDIEETLHKLSPKEKAELILGAHVFETTSLPKRMIHQLVLADGPHGIAKSFTERNHVTATHFPCECSMAASFDKDAVREIGELIGLECQAYGVHIILGPGTTIKRHPLCGRNFEYFSEDPMLSSALSASWITGVQSCGVGTCLKHFAGNNQEKDRSYVSSEIDERTLREIYLKSFEYAVKTAKPWSIMCSYNKINGVYSSENGWLLDAVLRKDWGFNGVVISDWLAVHNPKKALENSLDIQMPVTKTRKEDIKQISTDPNLQEKLDESVRRILKLTQQRDKNFRQSSFVLNDHHERAKELATKGIVLLKNDMGILPLNKKAKVALIGPYAQNPKIQGYWSSCYVKPSKTDNLADEIRKYGAEVSLVTEIDKQDAIKEAVDNSDVAVVCIGTHPKDENEAHDRESIDMPEDYNNLVDFVSKLGKMLVVVLFNGAPVTMPWVDKADGIIEAYYPGQGASYAVASVLFGETNPSGRLPETFPLKIEDTPAFGNFPGESYKVKYEEGIFVGYRHYGDDKPVLFPFGFGLSYTSFKYSDFSAKLTKNTVEVSVDIKNIGKVEGAEVVQIYTSESKPTVKRPVRELKAFTKISLKPDESRTVSLSIPVSELGFWCVEKHRWVLNPGSYKIMACSDARTVISESTINIH